MPLLAAAVAWLLTPAPQSSLEAHKPAETDLASVFQKDVGAGRGGGRGGGTEGGDPEWLQRMTGRGGGGIFVAVSPALVRLSHFIVCVCVRACMYARALDVRPSLAPSPETHTHTLSLPLSRSQCTHTHSPSHMHACTHARTRARLVAK
jgi:hypothetical protein